MSIVTLDPEVRKKLEHALSAKIPDPDDEAFEGFARSLRLVHPELHRELLQGVRVAVTMPVERAVNRAAWRGRLRETVNRLFFQKQWPDQRVLDKKRLMYAGLGGLMLLLPVAFLLSGNLNGSLSEAGVPASQPAEEIVRAGQTAQPPERAEITPEHLSNDGEASNAPVASQPMGPANDARTPMPPERLTQSGTTTSSSPSFTPFPTTTPPQPIPTQLPPSFPNQSSEPMLPKQLTVATSSPVPEAILLWQKGASSAMRGGSAFPGGLPSSLSSGAAAAKGPTVFVRPTDLVPALTVYLKASATPEASPPLSVLAFGPEGQKPDGGARDEEDSNQQSEQPNPTVYTRTGRFGSLSSDSPTVFSQNQAGTIERAASSNTTVNTESQPVVNITNPPQATETGSWGSLRPGDRLPAALATGVVITGDVSVPVLAESMGDWCGTDDCPEVTWIGEAILSANDRVEIYFMQAVVGGELRSVSGVALDDGSMWGLPAELESMSPYAAQALFQSAVGGVSDYLSALANQKRLVFQGDSVIQEGQVPNIESFILGRVAGLLAPPTTQTAEVRVASVPIGTPLMVLYGVGGN